MENITARTREILIRMLEKNEAVSIQSLAGHLNVSKRTIQRELEYLGSSLKGYQLEFCSKTGIGVWLEGEAAEKERLLTELKQDFGHDAANKQERRKKLLLEILKEKGIRKLFYYSNLLNVSEATVGNDLEAISGWLAAHQLHVVRKPGSGVAVEGSEGDYRKAIRDFIDENIDSEMIQNFYEKDQFDAKTMYLLKKSNIGHLLDDEVLQRVVDCLVRLDDSGIYTLTEHSYLGLILHIAIAMNRILQAETLAAEDVPAIVTEDEEEYILAGQIVKALEAEFALRIPEIEISYIYLHIKGSKHQQVLGVESEDMLALVNDMVNAFDEEQAFALKQDDEFIKGLLAHLQPTFIRLTHQMKINNPILADIKKEYKEIFEKCQNVAKVLENRIQKEVPEEEIGYLAIHFGAAAVRLNTKKEELRPVSVGVICASGIGLSKLMLSKLEKTFRERVILEAYGKKDLTPYVIARTDFFINSISLEVEGAHTIQVSPLLSESDLHKIDEALCHYERMPGKETKESKLTFQLEQVNNLAAAIKLAIEHVDLLRMPGTITFEELVLETAGAITPITNMQAFIAEDIFKRERLNSQVFAEFGFALLHARTKGVTYPKLTVALPAESGCFEGPYLKGVWAALFMLIPEDDNSLENSKMFGHLSGMLIEEPTFLETIIRGDKDEIKAELSKYLREFFVQYLNQFK